jgi:hypothetical protein
VRKADNPGALGGSTHDNLRLGANHLRSRNQKEKITPAREKQRFKKPES